MMTLSFSSQKWINSFNCNNIEQTLDESKTKNFYLLDLSGTRVGFLHPIPACNDPILWRKNLSNRHTTTINNWCHPFGSFPWTQNLFQKVPMDFKSYQMGNPEITPDHNYCFLSSSIHYSRSNVVCNRLGKLSPY